MSFEKTIKLIFILLTAFLVLMVWLGATSCNVMKHKQSKSVDSSSTKTTSSTASSETKAQSRSETDWWRQVYEYTRPDGDTIINNYYTQPTRVIFEGGNSKNESQLEKKDTAAGNTNEAKSVSIDETDKRKESKMSPLWWLAILYGGVELVKVVLNVFRGKYKLVKNDTQSS